jgi:3-deoxy-D-manno-octulosonic-acid transferase
VPWVLNVLYLMVLLLAAPWLLYRRWRQGKKLGGLHAKLTGCVSQDRQTGNSSVIWLHAVSVGEVLLLQPIIQRFRLQYPDYRLTLSVSTTTGREVAEKTYPDLTVIWFPFDFTWAVNRALDLVQPSLILLAELELWPNFITLAHRRDIPVIVVNGRIGERSARGYRRLRWLWQPLWRKITCFAVQQDDYAKRLRDLGMPPERIVVTGSVKFDGVTVHRHDPRVMQLRYDLQLAADHLVWVVGSTQAPEEAWALELFQKLQPEFPTLRLILVPRHQERFDEVARLIEDQQLYYRRRSQLSSSGTRSQVSGLVLLDTLGELKAAWGLADVGFVGGSFNDRGGQNMIEPAAYGVAVTFGPNTWNFKQVVSLLLQEQAAIEVHSKEEWLAVTRQLLENAKMRAALGTRAQQLVANQQGATAKTMELLAPYLAARAQAA